MKGVISHELQLSNESPLFILKYKRWRIVWRLIFPLSFIIPISYMMVFDWAHTRTGLEFLFSIIIGGFIFFSFTFQLIDMIFFKEVRFYKDRVVKAWYLLGERSIMLQNASLDGSNNLIISVKKIYDKKIKVFFAPFKGIFYDETLACRKDVTAVNRLLAELSNRKPEEFKRYRTSFKPLIKGEANE